MATELTSPIQCAQCGATLAVADYIPALGLGFCPGGYIADNCLGRYLNAHETMFRKCDYRLVRAHLPATA